MGFRNYRQHDMGDFKRWGINIDWVHLRHWNSFPAANHHQQKHELEKAAQMSSSQANLEPVLSSGPTHIKIKACPLALASLNKPHILRCYTCCWTSIMYFVSEAINNVVYCRFIQGIRIPWVKYMSASKCMRNESSQRAYAFGIYI